MITGVGKAFPRGGDLDIVRRMAGNYGRVANMPSEMNDMGWIINC